MSRDIKFALLYVAMCAGLYVVIFAVMHFGRENGISTYPHYLLPAAALVPMFMATFFTTALIKNRPEPFSRKEFITFALIVIVCVAIASAIAEAQFVYANLKDTFDLTFSKVLFAPLDERYTVSVLFGLSFWASATAVAAYVALLRIPGTLASRLHMAKQAAQKGEAADT